MTSPSDMPDSSTPQEAEKWNPFQGVDRVSPPVVAPMADSYFILLERLIGESTFNARVYLSCTFALVIFAVGGVVVSIIWLPNESFAKMFTYACGIFSPIPLPLFLATRYQRIYRTFLRTRWLEAQGQNDTVEIKKVKEEIKKLGYKMQWFISWKGSGKSDDDS